MPTPKEGEILVAVSHMSLDPYMRGRMDDAKSYAAPVPIGGKMEGGSVGVVTATNSAHFAVGDHVFGPFGWATHAVQKAAMMRKLDPSHGPITAALRTASSASRAVSAVGAAPRSVCLCTLDTRRPTREFAVGAAIVQSSDVGVSRSMRCDCERDGPRAIFTVTIEPPVVGLRGNVLGSHTHCTPVGCAASTSARAA